MNSKTVDHTETSLDKEVKRVLLVEDDAIDRRTAEQLLAMCQSDVEFSVESVDTLAAAVDRLSNEEYDIVLLDLNLPDSTGVKTVREVSKATLAPIIVLTRQDDEQTGILAIRNGAIDYVLKDESLASLLVRTVLYALERRKAEDQLRENEAKYRALFESSGDAVMILSPKDFKFRNANRATLEMFGCRDEEELTGKSPIDLSPDCQRDGTPSAEKAHKMVAECLEKGSNFLEWTHKRTDGCEFPATVLLAKFELAGETLVQATVRDITEQKRKEQTIFETNCRLQETSQKLLIAKKDLEDKARSLEEAHTKLELRVEERTAELHQANEHMQREIAKRSEAEAALRVSEANLSQIISTSPNGILVVGRDGVTKFVNPAAEGLFGRKAKELLGQLFGLPLIKDETTEIDIVHRGEESRTAEMWVVDTVWGGQSAYLVLLQDVTERMRAKQQIVHAAREWRTTFDSITDMISIHDRNFRITRVNRALANALRREPKELIGKTCYQLFHNAEQPCSGCPHIRTLETKDPATLELFEPRLGIHLGIATSPILDDDGEVISSVHIATDITERKLAEQHLEEANQRLTEYNQLKDDFISTASHELRTPLSVIMGAVRLVLDEIPGKIVEEQREVLCMARDNVQRLSKIVNSLLSISKIESGKLELQTSLIDICELIKGIVSDYEPLAQEKNIRLDHEVPEHNLNICLDPDKIHEVLTNLISNSLKFTPEGGWIKVTCGSQDNHVLLTVQDSGVGVAEEDIPKLFDKFTQFGRKAGPGEKGTGLGLAIAKKLVEMHGGTIDVKSEVNKGTTFAISIPMTAGAETENLSAETDEVMESALTNT